MEPPPKPAILNQLSPLFSARTKQQLFQNIQYPFCSVSFFLYPMGEIDSPRAICIDGFRLGLSIKIRLFFLADLAAPQSKCDHGLYTEELG